MTDALKIRFLFAVIQQFIGNLNVKTKIVHFYAQRKSKFGPKQAVIPFDVAPINEGNAFDLSSGTFHVPVPGIYYFYLSAVKDKYAASLNIDLQVNGKRIGIAYTESAAKGSYPSVSLSASLRLATFDRVSLLNYFDSVLFENGNHVTHFTGWLVEEDLFDVK